VLLRLSADLDPRVSCLITAFITGIFAITCYCCITERQIKLRNVTGET
jgi:hypothetical protein